MSTNPIHCSSHWSFYGRKLGAAGWDGGGWGVEKLNELGRQTRKTELLPEDEKCDFVVFSMLWTETLSKLLSLQQREPPFHRPQYPMFDKTVYKWIKYLTPFTLNRNVRRKLAHCLRALLNSGRDMINIQLLAAEGWNSACRSRSWSDGRLSCVLFLLAFDFVLSHFVVIAYW